MTKYLRNRVVSDNAIIIKLCEKKIRYIVMKEKLKKAWCLQARFDIMDVDNKFYIMKFDLKGNKERVIFNYVVNGCFELILFNYRATTPMLCDLTLGC